MAVPKKFTQIATLAGAIASAPATGTQWDVHLSTSPHLWFSQQDALVATYTTDTQRFDILAENEDISFLGETKRIGFAYERKTNIGTFKGAALSSETTPVFADQETKMTLGALEFANTRVVTRLTFNDGEQSGGSGAFGYRFNNGLSLEAGYASNAPRKTLEGIDGLIKPRQRTRFFSTPLQTRGDRRLNEDMVITGSSLGIGYKGGRTSLHAQYFAGEMVEAGFSEDLRALDASYAFDGERGRTRLEVQIDEIAQAAVDGRIMIDMNYAGSRFDAGLTGYMWGGGASLSDVVEFPFASGAGVRMRTRIGNVRVGPFATFEKNDAELSRVAQAGLSVRVADYELLAGASNREDGRRRFLEVRDGYFLGVGKESKRSAWNITVGTESSAETQGKSNIYSAISFTHRR